MKKLISLILVFLCITVIAGAQNQTRGGKILIAYFTQPENTSGTDAVSGASVQISGGQKIGNIEFVAKMIQEKTGGEFFEIKTQNQYPKTHNALLDYTQKELGDRQKPRLSTHISNMNEYDIIFIGYPIWWYTLPMVIYSFLDEYDLSGKTVIPFCVHGGSGFADTIRRITEQEPRAKMLEGFTVSRNTVARSERDVTAWLRRLGMTKQG
jgi:flavodoxin